MAEFAYACRPCDGSAVTWYISAESVGRLGRDVDIVRVKVGNDWRCAKLDRSHHVSVESMLVRMAVASDAQDCPECASPAEKDEAAVDDVAVDSSGSGAETEAADSIVAGGPGESQEVAPSDGGAAQCLAAAVSIGGRQFVVVLAKMDLVRSSAEADMAIERLSPAFGGVPVVLMGQRDEDGAPAYYGDSDLVDLVQNVPVDKLPWRTYKSPTN